MKNKHGIEGRSVFIGNHFVSLNGSNYEFIPEICFSCKNFDIGEFGDYGSKLGPAYCTKNVWWPTKKGTCKKYEE